MRVKYSVRLAMSSGAAKYFEIFLKRISLLLLLYFRMAIFSLTRHAGSPWRERDAQRTSGVKRPLILFTLTSPIFFIFIYFFLAPIFFLLTFLIFICARGAPTRHNGNPRSFGLSCMIDLQEAYCESAEARIFTREVDLRNT